MTLRAQRRDLVSEPSLTVAVPAYGHWEFLRVCLDSVLAQTCRDFEIVVSEDCSAEDRTAEVVEHLQRGGIDYQVHRQARNLGYDGNLRFCLRAARGRHVLLLGHDDALASETDVDHVIGVLEDLRPHVAFTNVEDWATGTSIPRAAGTAVLGHGVDAAISHFRTFSFVGGLILERSAAARHDTDRWDGSVYYQIYLACRILAEGGRLASIARPCVRKDIRIDGRPVATYATVFAAEPASLQVRPTGLQSVIRVTVDAVGGNLEPAARRVAVRRVARDVLLYSYLFWLLEYRRLGGVRAAIGVARATTPAKLLPPNGVSRRDRLVLQVVYVSVTAAGLTMPGDLMLRTSRRVADALRRRRQLAPA